MYVFFIFYIYIVGYPVQNANQLILTLNYFQNKHTLHFIDGKQDFYKHSVNYVSVVLEKLFQCV